MSDDLVHWLLEEFWPGTLPGQIERLAGAGGFSGVRLWRVRTRGTTFCLRRWPREHPLPDRLRGIHAVLTEVRGRGLPWVPAPLCTTRGETFVQVEGHFWELAPWLAGVADFHRRPSPARLRAAMVALAHFHRAAAGCGGETPTTGRSPGIQERLSRLDNLRTGRLAELLARFNLRRPADEAMLRRAARLGELFTLAAADVRRILEPMSRTPCALQPAIRDVWHDHVLFTGSRVTGLVDFGAMRIESPAADVARLLGSLVGDDDSRWNDGLAAYERIRPLAEAERRLVTAFDRSGTCLGGLNWVEWLGEDTPRDWHLARIAERLDDYVARLEHLVGADCKRLHGQG